MPSYVLKRKKNYYKRVWEDWTQPVLTANGTMGGESFAVNQSSTYASNRQAWVAFDGVDTGADWNSAQGVPQWISWYNPVPLSISKITVVNTIETAYPDTIKDYEVQVSDDNAVWKTIYSGTNTTGAGETWDVDLSNVENSSKYWRIYITSCNNRNYARITELKITAKVQRIIQVNLDGEDVWEDFEQPILSANGVIGGDKFAVTESGSWDSSQPAFNVFDEDISNTHSVFTKSSGYFMFYNPKYLNVTKLTIRNLEGDGWGTRAWTAGTVSGSNDGVNFEEVTSFTNSTTGSNAYWDIDMSANTKGYKCYKIIVTETSYANAGAASQCSARNIQITAKELTKIGSDDYDFMDDAQTYILKRKPYMKYVYNDWEQPVLTANGTIGGDSFAVSASSYYDSARQPWNAFDGINSNSESGCWHAGSGYPQWLSFYNPKLLRVTNLKIINRYAYNGETGAPMEYQIQTSANGENWTTIYSGTNENVDSQASWDINLADVSGNISKYWRIYITSSQGSYVVIGEVEITAQEAIAVSGTQTDYDYIGEAKSYALNIIKYRDVPNVTVVGSPTIVDNVVSGFSSANYLTLPELFRPENNPWERVICFTTGSDVANAQMLNYINYASEQVAGAYIQIYQSKMNMQLSSNGSSWDISSNTSAITTLLPNTSYYAKLRFTGSEYQMLLSTTGEFKGEETLEAIVASSTPIYQSNTGADRLGYRVGSQVFTGSIDLSKCYGNINNERWWSGVKAEKY